jgi:hypothetical protein
MIKTKRLPDSDLQNLLQNYYKFERIKLELEKKKNPLDS